MSLSASTAPSEIHDPLDVLETVASDAELGFERVDNDELHIQVSATWRDIAVWFAWRPELQTLQMGAPLDLKIPEATIMELCRLLALVNERMWIGHFDLWSDDNQLVYRHAMALSDEGALDELQAEFLLRGAAEAFDRFYPAFDFVAQGKTAQDALDLSLYETAGSA
ncbi:MAG: YbjN domain-containing protein [Pseudomonadota bacterium]